MSEDRPTGDRESRPPDAEPEESVGPARPIPGGDDDERPEPPTTAPDSPSGEFVGPSQPMEPARRRPAGGRETEAPPREAAVPDEKPEPEEQPVRRPQAGRPAAGRGPSSRRARAASARGAVDRVRRADFPVVLRGYDRAAVDAYVADVAQLVAELEATQLPETVVQRALDEVGDETSAILKRAHEAGEEIAARSRSQAESRLQRADREAELTRKEAEDQVSKLEEDIQNVWQERQRLIEDIRTLADDVLALADDAIERMPAPDDRDEEQERAAAGGGAPGTGPPPLGLAAEPPSGDTSTEQEDEELDEVTVERRPEDQDTDERPPGSAGA